MKWTTPTILALAVGVSAVAMDQSAAPPAARRADDAAQPTTLPTTQPAARAAAIEATQAIVVAFLNADERTLRRLVSPRLSDQLLPDALRRLPGVLESEHGPFVALGQARVAYDRADPSLSIVTFPVFQQ